MKTKILAALLVCVTVALTSVMQSRGQEKIDTTAATGRWEYKILEGRILNDEVTIGADKLNKFGNEGWELVSIWERGGCLHVYLKRPAQ